MYALNIILITCKTFEQCDEVIQKVIKRNSIYVFRLLFSALD